LECRQCRPRSRPVAHLALYSEDLMVQCETMNVGLGRTSLVVAASDGPGG
jgi:hypothetical protein